MWLAKDKRNYDAKLFAYFKIVGPNLIFSL